MSGNIIIPGSLSKEEKYKFILPQVESLIEGETDTIANLANISAVLKYSFDFWWVGFYLIKGQYLILGPFQGPVACSRIPYGKGVCGASWKEEKTIIVPDVDRFPGHIACSSESKSEIVVPLFNKERKITGVLDIDSAYLNTFDETDTFYLEKLITYIQI